MSSRQRGLTDWLVIAVLVPMVLLGACILGLGVCADLPQAQPSERGHARRSGAFD